MAHGFESLHPELKRAIMSAPAHLRSVLAATAMVESGGNPYGPGGDNGQSWGAYQEYTGGRGAGLSKAQRQDPVASTQRAAAEFQRFYDQGLRGAELAYAAQRPANRDDYISKISGYLDESGEAFANGPAPAPSDLAERASASMSGSSPAMSISERLNQALSNRGGQSMAKAAGNAVLQDALAPKPEFSAPEEAGHEGHNHGQNAGHGALEGPTGGFNAGGGPEAHHSRALGNWQSDDAYDIMGQSGQVVPVFHGGKVVKISGQPGGDPGFAGYGVTVELADGSQLFYKHLGQLADWVRPGASFRAGMNIGTLDAATAGGPHLHLGGTNRDLLDRLNSRYLG